MPVIAEYLDISIRRINQLVKKGVLPKQRGEEYDLLKCVHGYIHYLRDLAQGKGEQTLTDERTRLAGAQADLKELEIEQRQGELVSTDWVVQAYGRVFEGFRARMLSIPVKLAPKVYSADSMALAKDRIETEINAALAELSHPPAKVLSAYLGTKERTRQKKTSSG